MCASALWRIPLGWFDHRLWRAQEKTSAKRSLHSCSYYKWKPRWRYVKKYMRWEGFCIYYKGILNLSDYTLKKVRTGWQLNIYFAIKLFIFNFKGSSLVQGQCRNWTSGPARMSGVTSVCQHQVVSMSMRIHSLVIVSHGERTEKLQESEYWIFIYMCTCLILILLQFCYYFHYHYSQYYWYSLVLFQSFHIIFNIYLLTC